MTFAELRLNINRFICNPMMSVLQNQFLHTQKNQVNCFFQITIQEIHKTNYISLPQVCTTHPCIQQGTCSCSTFVSCVAPTNARIVRTSMPPLSSKLASALASSWQQCLLFKGYYCGTDSCLQRCMLRGLDCVCVFIYLYCSVSVWQMIGVMS